MMFELKNTASDLRPNMLISVKSVFSNAQKYFRTIATIIVVGVFDFTNLVDDFGNSLLKIILDYD